MFYVMPGPDREDALCKRKQQYCVKVFSFMQGGREGACNRKLQYCLKVFSFIPGGREGECNRKLQYCVKGVLSYAG